MQRSNSGGARWWFGAVYLVLLAFVVPWYWPAGDARHVHGVPIWALVTLLAVLVTSAFTAWIYLSRSEEEPGESPQRRDDTARRDDP